MTPRQLRIGAWLILACILQWLREHWDVAVLVALALVGIAFACVKVSRVTPVTAQRAEIAQLSREFADERTELDRIQRELAAYDASNKVAADEIHLLQSTLNP
jgi:Skp family chaperone for outer membrane proteins